ncbi:hypothetical protein RKE29_27165 [Streptomyces sp. B1866]|uniref:hypothetical protein n=1 Tax=Streptomyces sp. B1866 TaxID=3075431 RepID=UPI002892248D|nr:hypothetical protein [Streptomyces sp. B1866]MDT3400253.1 hypothetical protein [Streptomyces sp. B1866]
MRGVKAGLLGGGPMPMQVPMWVVERGQCIECGSYNTWPVDIAPTGARYRCRACDDCGKVIAARAVGRG